MAIILLSMISNSNYHNNGYFVQSVIMPPKQTIYNPQGPPRQIHNYLTYRNLDDGDDLPIVLSINEGDSIDTLINSTTHISVNLNRLVDKPTYVKISLNDTRDMLIFHKNNKDLYPTQDTDSHSVIIKYEIKESGDKSIFFTTNDIAGYTNIVCQVIEPPNVTHPYNQTSIEDLNQPKRDEPVKIDDSSAFITVNIAKKEIITNISDIVGWIYFFAWSLSFYSQVILNYRRKSVTGLNFDFLALNLVGFTYYMIFYLVMLYSSEVQKDYQKRHHLSRVSVGYNDLFFTIHAVLITLVTIFQCFIYERGEQSVHKATTISLLVVSSFGFILYILSVASTVLRLLDVINYLSYVKLAITFVKYVPQAWMNYRLKSTTGWSIYNILLDFMGGIFSICQMFLLAYNYNDWIQIFGNFTKFGLGLFSISFDLLFITQHYILYRKPEEYSIEPPDARAPVLSQSILDLNESNQNQRQPEVIQVPVMNNPDNGQRESPINQSTNQ